MPVDVSEIRELATDLSTSRARVGKQAADVLRETGKKVQRLAKQRAPRRTGTLANSINVKFSGDGRSASSMSAVIGTSVYYAKFQEYGTSRMRPHPFMNPAADAVEPEFEAAMAQLEIL